jgi:hypothetical protein
MEVTGYCADNEPNSVSAARAMRILEQTYGTNHALTIDAYQEVLRIQVIEDAAAAVVTPFHVTIGRLSRSLSDLEAKRCTQGKVIQQAKDGLTKAETRLAECTSVASEIDPQIGNIEAERDQILANMVPAGKRLLGTNEAGVAALDLFFQGASGVIEASILQTLRSQIASIAQQVHNSTTAGNMEAPVGAPDLTNTGTGAILQINTLDRISRGTSQDWNTTKTDLTTEHTLTAQLLQQANDTAALAAKTLVEATSAWADASLEEAVEAAAKQAETTDAAAKKAQEAETVTKGALQAHKNTANSAPYGRN